MLRVKKRGGVAALLVYCNDDDCSDSSDGEGDKVVLVPTAVLDRDRASLEDPSCGL